MLSNFGWWAIPTIIVVGVLHMQRHNKTGDSRPELVMNRVQVAVQITCYLAILLSTMVLTLGAVKKF
jgi:hypothetical protein